MDGDRVPQFNLMGVRCSLIVTCLVNIRDRIGWHVLRDGNDTHQACHLAIPGAIFVGNEAYCLLRLLGWGWLRLVGATIRIWGLLELVIYSRSEFLHRTRVAG